MTQENLASNTIQNLDSLNAGTFAPIQMPTAGEGAPGILRRITDFAQPTASGLATIGSTYRMCRMPTSARIKSVRVDLSGLDSNVSATLSLDINVAFSDSVNDGTNQQYLPINGLTALTATGIPKTGQVGTVTSITAYSSPNKLFGSITAANSGATKLNQDVTFNGSYAASGSASSPPNVAWAYAGPEYPLWYFLGFVDGAGTPADPGGFFDLLFYVGTAAATGAAGTIRAAVDFIF